MNDITEVRIKSGRVTYDAKINPGDVAVAQEAKEFAVLILDRIAGGSPIPTSTSRKAKRPKADVDGASISPSESDEESL